MPAALYTRLEATARRLIAKYGKAAKVIRVTKTGPAHAPTTSEVEHDCKLVDVGYELTLIPQTLVQANDKTGLISTDVAVAPLMTDKLLIDGGRYNFVALSPLNPGGTVLFHEFLARK